MTAAGRDRRIGTGVIINPTHAELFNADMLPGHGEIYDFPTTKCRKLDDLRTVFKVILIRLTLAMNTFTIRKYLG
jgi:hypothetical protein